MTEETTAPALTAALAPYVPAFVVDWAATGTHDLVRVVDGSLLSADISGFTALSERLAGMGRAGAEELTDLLNRCFDDMIATASAFGGDVLKFGGDALLILFRGDDHASRACSAAIGMRTSITKPLVSARAGRVKLRMSQGIHSGDFTLFLLNGSHRDLFVTGPGATATVECEAEANAGDILVSAGTAVLVDRAWLGEHRDGRVLLRRRQRGPSAAASSNGTERDVDLAPFLPAAQTQVIRAGVTGEHRHATVAFLKFTHTDHIIEDGGPEAFAQRLQRVTEIVSEATTSRRVHWLATDVYPDGGKFILAAGAPSSSGHDEDDMLHALRDIFDADLPLELQAGVNRGPVFVGDLGSATRRTLTVMGDTVNLAARLMQKAEPGQIVASRAVLERAVSRFATTELEPFYVKGKSKPIEASVLGARLGAQRAVELTEDAPFVARDAELARLQAALDAAARGNAYAVEIVGEAGMGKSRLVAEFRRRVQPPAFMTISCGQYLRATPYLAVRSALRTLAGIDPDADAVDAGEQLTAWVHDVAPQLEPMLPLIAIPFDGDVAPTPEADRIDARFRRARLEQSLMDLLQVVMPPHGVLLVEDAHWLDDASHGLLEEIVTRAITWTVICTRRPGPRVMSDDRTEIIELGELGADATAALVAALADEYGDLAAADVAALSERAGGNPLFVVELVATAAEQGGNIEALPDSIEQLVTSRMDLLDPPDRRLLRDASVLGASVDTVLLAEAIGDDSVRSVARWDALSAFLVPDDDFALRFRHALFRSVAYEGLSYRRRIEVHSAVGQVIERRAVDPRAVAGYLSMHFDASGDHERAWRYSILAGEDAREKYANVEAANFLQRALDNAKPAGVAASEQARAAEDLGDTLELLSRYDEADEAYRRARKATPDTGDTVRLLRKHARLHERVSRYNDAIRWLERARRAANDADPSQVANLVDVAIVYGAVRYRQGRYKDAIEWAREAARRARLVGDRRGLAHALDLLELARLSYARHDEHDDDDVLEPGGALAIYEELGDLPGQTSVLSNLALAAHAAGRWDEAVELGRRSYAVAEQAGDAGSAALALCNLGEVLCDQGRVDEARDALVPSRRSARAAKFEILIGATTLYLGRAEVRAGHYVEALPLLDEALELFERITAPSFVLETQIERAESLLWLRSCDEALKLVGTVLERLGPDEQDTKIRAALHRMHATCLLATRAIDDASAAINAAIALADRAGVLGEMARALVIQAAIVEAGGTATVTAESALQLARRLFSELGVVDGDTLITRSTLLASMS